MAPKRRMGFQMVDLLQYTVQGFGHTVYYSFFFSLLD